jgi:hypothetical protein
MPRSETVDPTPQGDAAPAPELDEEALFPAPDGPAPSQASEAARIRRARQTTRNLILALIATLAAVGLMLVLVPRDDSSQLERVDWAARAESLQGQAAMTLASPVLPDGWYANHADYEDDTTDGLQTWDVGFVTPATVATPRGSRTSSPTGRPPASARSPGTSSRCTTSAARPGSPRGRTTTPWSARPRELH